MIARVCKDTKGVQRHQKDIKKEIKSVKPQKGVVNA
jgi:hypothetical protein